MYQIVRDDGAESYLATLREELRRRRFEPSPARRVFIPKGNKTGKMRPLGIPTVIDRVVQAALKNVLEPIFEADFYPVSYGFRPGRGAHGESPNDWWTVDFKGWWSAKDGARCEPLTVRDAATRYALCAQLMESTGADSVRAAFERVFEKYGLPKTIQVDSGPPFASTRARLGMTTLSAWWVSLGIRVVRGRPSHPEDNGGHERMHLDIRYDVEYVRASSVTAQQQRLDEWRHEFNHVRPHEALGQEVPAELDRPSPRRFCGSRGSRYPPQLAVRRVTHSGRCRYRGSLIRVGQGFRGYDVGIESVDQTTVRVQFYELDLGTFPLLNFSRKRASI